MDALITWVPVAARAVGGYLQLAGLVAIGLLVLAGIGWLFVRTLRGLGRSILRTRSLIGPVPTSVALFYTAYGAAILLSAMNSWRVASAVLQYPVPIRVGVLVLIEGSLLAIAVGMHHETTMTSGNPRRYQPYLYGLLVFITGGAIAVLGPVDGVFQGAVVGLGVLMLHLALGIELRTAGKQRTGTLARVAGELRERILSRLGLADDDRDALSRTRDRAAIRAARLAFASARSPWRKARLTRALRASGVAHDDSRRARLLRELGTQQHADALSTLNYPSPWGDLTTSPGSPAALVGNLSGTETDAAPVTSGAAPTGAGSPALGDLAAEDAAADPDLPVAVVPLADLLTASTGIAQMTDPDRLPVGTHEPMCYFLANGNRIKIGTTTNIRGRIASLSLRVSDVVLAIPGGEHEESILHNTFRGYRIGNTEWFELTGDLVQFLDQVKSRALYASAEFFQSWNASNPNGNFTPLTIVPRSQAELVRQMIKNGVTDAGKIHREAVKMFGTSANLETIKRHLRRSNVTVMTKLPHIGEGGYL